MARKKKENRILTTTVNVGEEVLARINDLKKPGETQHECMDRIVSQFILLEQLREERDLWEQEAKEWKRRYYTKSNLYGTLQNRVEELEEVMRTQQIQISTG